MNELALVEKIIQFGVLGPLLVGAVWLLWRQQRMLLELNDRIRDAQDKRAQDANAVVDKLLKLNTEWRETITSQIRFIESLEGGVNQLVQSVRESNQTLQELRVLLGPGAPRVARGRGGAEP